MMNRRCGFWLGLLLLLSTPARAGAPSYRWTVVRRLVPDPVAGHTRVALLPPGFDGLYVDDGPEARYLQQRSERQRLSWEEDKRVLATTFTGTVWREVGAQLDLRPGPGALRVRPRVRYISPGWSMGFGGMPTEVVLSCQILDQGEIVEEVDLRVQVQSRGSYSIGARLREAGELLGRDAARYLALRAIDQEPRGGGRPPAEPGLPRAAPAGAVSGSVQAKGAPGGARFFVNMKLGPWIGLRALPALFDVTVEPGVRVRGRPGVFLSLPFSASMASGIAVITVPLGVGLEVPLPLPGLVLTPRLSAGYGAVMVSYLGVSETLHMFAVVPEFGARYLFGQGRAHVGLDALSLPVLAGADGVIVAYRISVYGGLRF